MRVASVRRVILREDHTVRRPFKVADGPPTGQEAKPFGVKEDLSPGCPANVSNARFPAGWPLIREVLADPAA